MKTHIGTIRYVSVVRCEKEWRDDPVVRVLWSKFVIFYKNFYSFSAGTHVFIYDIDLRNSVFLELKVEFIGVTSRHW